MGVEQCIHKSKDDKFIEGGKYDCSQSLDYGEVKPVRKIRIKCIDPLGNIIHQDAVVCKEEDDKANPAV